MANLVLILAAAIATLAAWIFTVDMARAMALTIPMPGGWSMSMAWMEMGNQTWLERALMFLTMWTVMMVAMMLPSVMPAVLLHRRLLQSRRDRRELPGGSELLLLVGYFGVWIGFGGVAYLLGTTIADKSMSAESISRLIPPAVGMTLIAAGLYQVTAWKQACLAHCRSPLSFFSHHDIQRYRDSLVFGVHHGMYCAACCWGLMAIQLALGIMSLPLMVAIAAVIWIEKQWKHGEAFAVAVGTVAIVAGTMLLLRATAI